MFAVHLFCPDKTLEQIQPRFVCCLVHVEAKIDTNEKFAFHAIDFIQLNARDFRPCLVCVSIAEVEINLAGSER
jgi:hypothetical protein